MPIDKSYPNKLDVLGFDVKSAMKLLGDNEELYFTVLQRFYDNYNRVPRKLLSLSFVKDKEELQRTAHTIKGLAATIGASDLQIKAKATEYAIREGREPMLLTLSAALSDCMQTIEEYFNLAKASQAKDKYSIAGLIIELDNSQFISDQELELFEPVLTAALDTNSQAKVLQAIQCLDYPLAIQILRRVPS